MSRCIVVDEDGAICATVSGNPRQFAAQALVAGQAVYAIINDDGGQIDDRIWFVDATGVLAMKPGAEGREPPPYELFLIVA